MKGKLSAAAALAGGAVTLGAYRARKPKPLGVNYSDAPAKVLIVGGRVRGAGCGKGIGESVQPRRRLAQVNCRSRAGGARRADGGFLEFARGGCVQ